MQTQSLLVIGAIAAGAYFLSKQSFAQQQPIQNVAVVQPTEYRATGVTQESISPLFVTGKILGSSTETSETVPLGTVGVTDKYIAEGYTWTGTQPNGDGTVTFYFKRL